MTFDEWFEKARTQEPYCWRGITQEDIWEAGQKAEREACARVADDWQLDDACETYLCSCATAIRERGEKK